MLIFPRNWFEMPSCRKHGFGNLVFATDAHHRVFCLGKKSTMLRIRGENRKLFQSHCRHCVECPSHLD